MGNNKSIQILVFNEKKTQFEETDKIAINSFGKAADFDAYKLTIISLQDANIWKNKKNNYYSINIQSDITTISSLIHRASTCKTLILLPKDYIFYYHHYSYNNEYTESKPLRDLLPTLNSDILGSIYSKSINLNFGHSKTIVSGNTFEADFCLGDPILDIVPLQPQSTAETTTCFKIKERLFATTLYVADNNSLTILCDALHLLPKEQNKAPEWLNDVYIFDEEQLQSSRQSILQKISKLETQKGEIDSKLKEYIETKSILCKKDTDLEILVRRMLAEILNVTEEFEDKNEEDYDYETSSNVFVFEIKGSVGGLKRQHISKTHDHVQIVQDKLEESGSEQEAKGVLIFSNQIETPPSQRDPFPEKQITLAERDDVAVLSTEVFLRCYEARKKDELSIDEFLYLISNPGLVSFDVATGKHISIHQ